MAEKVSTEKALRKKLELIVDYIGGAGIDVYDSYGELLEVRKMAQLALAASETTDLERLVERIKKRRDNTIPYGRQNAYDLVLKDIAEEFGVGEGE